MPVAVESCSEIPREICIGVPVTECVDRERQQCKQWPRETCTTVQVCVPSSRTILKRNLIRKVPVGTSLLRCVSWWTSPSVRRSLRSFVRTFRMRNASRAQRKFVMMCQVIHYSSHILFHISSCQERCVRASRRSCVTSSRRRSAPLWRRPAASPRGGLSARSSARRACGAKCAPRPLPTLTSHCQMSPRSCSHHPRVKPRTENSSPTSDSGRSWCSGQTLATWRKWSVECGFQNQLKIKSCQN